MSIRRLVLVSLAIVAVGHVLLADYQESGRIVGDARHYLQMAEGRPAASPYRWRVLAPGLARVLPFDALTGLRLVTYAGLALGYGAAMWTAQTLGARPMACVLAAMAVAARPGHLFQYEDPFLTDGAAIGAVGMMIASVPVGAFLVFLAACVAGVLAREPIAIGVVAWLPTREWSRAATVVAAVFLTFGAAWLLAPGTGDTAYSRSSLNGLGLGARVVWTWSFLWLAPFGLLLVADRRHRHQLGALALALIVFGLGATPFFTDTYRMFQPVVPLLIVGLALVYDHIPTWRAVGITGVALTGLLVQPSSALELTPESGTIRIAVLLIGVGALGPAILQALRAARSGRTALLR
jgi:hypothetical protein